jgi:excisionase family DNA binding protein
MPVPNAEPVLEDNRDPEPRLIAAKLMAEEVAKLLKVHPSMVYRMAKRGELPSFKIGSAWRFDRAQIREWIRSRSERPET